MTVIFDAGALLALERDDRAMWTRLKAAHRRRMVPQVNAGVLAQVWRGGHGRQAVLARALAGLEVVSIDRELGKRAGMLMVRVDADTIDATVAAMAIHGDVIYTSDPEDLARLTEGLRIDVVPV